MTKNNFRIFYSWQSDLPSETNKNLIRTCLRKAVKQVKGKLEVEVEVDEATRNVPGSPNITETIFHKIGVSDIFIADISIISSGSESKLTPNPN